MLGMKVKTSYLHYLIEDSVHYAVWVEWASTHMLTFFTHDISYSCSWSYYWQTNKERCVTVNVSSRSSFYILMLSPGLIASWAALRGMVLLQTTRVWVPNCGTFCAVYSVVFCFIMSNVVDHNTMYSGNGKSMIVCFSKHSLTLVNSRMFLNENSSLNH